MRVAAAVDSNIIWRKWGVGSVHVDVLRLLVIVSSASGPPNTPTLTRISNHEGFPPAAALSPLSCHFLISGGGDSLIWIQGSSPCQQSADMYVMFDNVLFWNRIFTDRWIRFLKLFLINCLWRQASRLHVKTSLDTWILSPNIVIVISIQNIIAYMSGQQSAVTIPGLELSSRPQLFPAVTSVARTRGQSFVTGLNTRIECDDAQSWQVFVWGGENKRVWSG